MYKLYDYYEGEDLIAVSDDYHEILKERNNYLEETDCECDLEIVYIPKEV